MGGTGRGSRARARRGGFLLLAALLAAGACGAPERRAAGQFEPARPGVLTIATATVPAPGFWEGALPRPDGGFERELAWKLAARFDLDQVAVVQVPFERLVAGDLGGADLALSQLTDTAARREHLAFSTPYLAAAPAALVRAGTEVPDAQAARELRWAVQRRSTLEGVLDDVVEPEPAVLRAERRSDSLAALDDGTVDAVLLDLPVAMALARESEGTLAVAAQLPVDDSLSAALEKGSKNGEAVDSTVRAFRADGTLDELAREWIGGGAEHVPVLRIDR